MRSDAEGPAPEGMARAASEPSASDLEQGEGPEDPALPKDHAGAIQALAEACQQDASALCLSADEL